MVKAVLPNYSVSDRALQKHSDRVKATPGQQYSRSHTGGSRSWNLPHFDTKLCTYILDIVSGNGLVVTINRPFGYNYDIQPFHPCSVLQGGVVEKQHDRKTQTLAVTWSFRSTGARRCKRLGSWGQILSHRKSVLALCNQRHPADLTACLSCIIVDLARWYGSLIRNKVDFFSLTGTSC